MITLDATTKTLEIDLTGAVATNQLPFVASYVDISQSTFAMTGIGEQDGTSNSTTAVTCLSAPAASTSRVLKFFSWKNSDTAAREGWIQLNNNGTLREIWKGTLQVGDTLEFVDADNFRVIDSNGAIKTSTPAALSVTSITLGGGSALANFTTWAAYTPTVTLVGGAGNTVPVYTTNSGRWMQIGKIVFVDVFLAGDGGAEGAGTGNFSVALPVAIGSSTAASDYVAVGRGVNGATRYNIYVELAPSATVAGLAYWAGTTTFSLFTGADQNDTSRSVRLHFFYEVN